LRGDGVMKLKKFKIIKLQFYLRKVTFGEERLLHVGVLMIQTDPEILVLLKV